MSNVNDFEVAEYSGEGQGETGPNAAEKIHSVLRGRYKWAIGLFVAFAAAGGVAGYRATKPKFDSVALLRIKSNNPYILKSTDINGPMQAFDSFMDSQVALVSSERVLNMAMLSPDWRALHREPGPEALDQFKQSLAVDRRQRSEIITVTYRDPDAEAAVASVRSVVEAYKSIYEDNDSDPVGGRSRAVVLDELKSSQAAKVKAINDDIAATCKELGTTDVAKMLDMRLESFYRVESELREAKITLAMADGSTTRPGEAATRPAQAGVPDLNQLARIDQRVADMLRQKTQVEGDLSLLRVKLAENNPQLRATVERLADLDRRLDKIVAEYSASPQLLPGGALPGAGGAAGPAVSVERLKDNVRKLEEYRDELKLATQALAAKAEFVRTRREDADAASAKLKEISQRIESLSVEAQGGGRLSVISAGDRPLKAAVDNRIKYSLGGALMAGLFGAGLVFARGLMDPRLRHIEDATQTRFGAPRILGVVPTLFGSADDTELTANAAHAVHNIRVQLQMEVNPTGQRAIAITSPSPGSGKTSLTMALGMSFAASGCRTLVIDCDLVGGGLSAMTRRMSRKRLGQILVRRGVVTREQLRDLLDEALREGRRLGEVVRARGLADEATIERLLGEQATSSSGLREALRGEPLEGCTIESGVPRLSVLPLGEATRQDAGRISPTDIRKLLARCKEEYDTVLIDTGPILGGLEAMIAASVADAAVVTLASGENRGLAHQAFESLQRAKANVAGVIFNRASQYDLRQSVFSTSVSRHSVARLPAPPVAEQAKARPILASDGIEFGPIGSAVASSADVLGEEGT